MTKLKFLPCLLLILSNWSLADEYHPNNPQHDEETEIVQVQTLAKTSFSWNGDALPFYPETEPEITILKINIPAGAKLPIHKHPVINAGVLLKGELTVLTEDESESLQLEAGDAIVELVDKWHFGFNMGDRPAEIIVFYAGTPDTPITITKSEVSRF